MPFTAIVRSRFGFASTYSVLIKKVALTFCFSSTYRSSFKDCSVPQSSKEENHFIIREDTALVQTFDFARRKSRKLLSRVDKPGSDVVILNPVKAVLIGRHIRQDIFIQRDIRLFLIAQRIFSGESSIRLTVCISNRLASSISPVSCERYAKVSTCAFIKPSSMTPKNGGSPAAYSGHSHNIPY